MGLKNSVLKRNKTISSQNGTNTIQNVSNERNPVNMEKFSEEVIVPNCEEKEKDQTVESFNEPPSEKKDDCNGSAMLVKPEVTDGPLEVDVNSTSETAFTDEDITKTPELQDGSKNCSHIITNKSDQPLNSIESWPRNDLQIVLANNRDIVEIQQRNENMQSISCETDLLEEVDVTHPSDFDDELFFLINSHFNSYPTSKCLSPNLSQEQNFGKEEQFLLNKESSKKEFIESRFGSNDVVKRFILDTGSSLNQNSEIVGPQSLNVAVVKGMIYRREIYGPPNVQPGQAGPSHPQVPIGIEEYVVSKHYNYSKDGSSAADMEPFGCSCTDSWGKNFNLKPPSDTHEGPPMDQSLKKMKSETSQPNLKKKKTVKGTKKTTAEKKKPSKKLGVAKKGSNNKDSSKKTGTKKSTPKKMSGKSTTSVSKKETPRKITGKSSKKKAGTKTVAKPTTIKSKPFKNEPFKTLKESDDDDDDDDDDGDDDGDDDVDPPSTPKSVKKVKSVKSVTSGKSVKLTAAPPIKQDIKKQKNRIENQPSNAENSNNEDSKYLFVNLEKCGPSNVRVGVSRTDNSGFDIMFKDEGDMKVKVEKIVSGKNRVFTYNSGNEATINEENPNQVKTTQTLPPENEIKTPLPADVRKQPKQLIKINVKVPKNFNKQKKVAKGKPSENEAKSNAAVQNTISERKSPSGQQDSKVKHSYAPPSHSKSPSTTANDKGDVAKHDSKKKDLSFDGSARSHHQERGSRKMSPSLVQESLAPIFEKYFPKDMGSKKTSDYVADVQTDKCTFEGNKIECSTTIPHVKVVFDVPGKKIETHTTKPKIEISQYDLHVDVGLDKIGPKYLEQMSQKTGRRYDSIQSHENVLPKTDNVHSVNYEDKAQTKTPRTAQSSVSLLSLQSNVNYESTDRKQIETNKYKSKLYDANKLLEIKECLSKMRLELRNDCPCLASRHEDREENNLRTDRVIIIHTKRKDNGEECSDESDSDNDFEKETFNELAYEMLKKKKTKHHKQKDNDKQYEGKENAPGESENKLVKDNKIEHDREKRLRKSVRPVEDESLNHPEISPLQSMSEEVLDVRSRRKKTISAERGRSIWDHPESTVTEDQVFLTKSIMKGGAINKKGLRKHTEVDEHVAFKKQSRELDEDESDEKIPLFRQRAQTGIFFQGKNLLAKSSFDSGEIALTDSKIDIEKENSSKEVLEHSSKSNHGHIEFDPSAASLNNGRSERPSIHRRPTGVFHFGRNLLKTTLPEDSSEDTITLQKETPQTNNKNSNQSLKPVAIKGENDYEPSECLSDASSTTGSIRKKVKKQNDVSFKNAGVTASDSKENEPPLLNKQHTGTNHQGTIPLKQSMPEKYTSSQILDVEYSQNSMLEPARNLEDSSECLSTGCVIRKRVRNEAIQKTSYGLRPSAKNVQDKVGLTSNYSAIKEDDDNSTIKNPTKFHKAMLGKNKSASDSYNSRSTGRINAVTLSENGTKKRAKKELDTSSTHRKPEPDQINTNLRYISSDRPYKNKKGKLNEEPSKLISSKLKDNPSTIDRKKDVQKGRVNESNDIDDKKQFTFDSWDSKLDQENRPPVCRLKPKTKDTFRYSTKPKGIVESNESSGTFSHVKSDVLTSSNSKNSNMLPVVDSSNVSKSKDDYYSNDNLNRLKSDALATSDSKTKSRPTICRLKKGEKEALIAAAESKDKEEASSDSFGRVKSDALNISDPKTDPNDIQVSTKKRSTACGLKKNPKKGGSQATGLPSPKEEGLNALQPEFSTNANSTASLATTAKEARETNVDHIQTGALKQSDSKNRTKLRTTICRLKEKEALLNAAEARELKEHHKSNDALNSSDSKIGPNEPEVSTKKRSTACRLKKSFKKEGSRSSGLQGSKEEGLNGSHNRGKPNASNSLSPKQSIKKRSTACRVKKIVKEEQAVGGPKNKEEELNNSIIMAGEKEERIKKALSRSSLGHKSSMALDLIADKNSIAKDSVDNRLKNAQLTLSDRKDLTAKQKVNNPGMYAKSPIPIGKVWVDHRLEKKVLTERLNSIMKSLCAICPPTGIAVRCCCGSGCMQRGACMLKSPPRRRTSHSPR